jgi:hypothetical protein
MGNNTVLTAKRSPKVHSDGFEKAFSSLPYGAISPVRITLMENIGWSIATFYYKKRGVSPIRQDEVSVVEAIFEGFGINAWTGEKI